MDNLEINENVERLKAATSLIREERRYYNNKLRDVVEGAEEYNSEDLMRLVGTLEAAYNHALASIDSDQDIFCLLKHMSYAIILAGELEVEAGDIGRLYDIVTIISNGRIEPCASCHREENKAEEK